MSYGTNSNNNNNYLLAPFVHMFYSNFSVLPLPDKLWLLLEIGVGGYIVGRSGEKIASQLKKIKRYKNEKITNFNCYITNHIN